MLRWATRRHELTNIYRQQNPDIILLNSHGVKQEESLKIVGYKTHMKNTTNTHTDGTAVLVKRSIPHKIFDDFISDLLAIEISTSTGKILIATLYQPPTRPYIPIPDFIRLFRHNCPVYLLADLNANHPTLGYRHTNTSGRNLNRLITNRTLQHIGPDFPTYLAHNTATTPDIILTNYKTHHNTYTSQGPLTTSDHIPIILTISAKPIQVPCQPRPNLSQANWENFSTEITETIESSPQPAPRTLEDIDSEIHTWYNTIHTATTNNIPTTRHRTLPHPPISYEAKLLTTQYNALQNHARTNGWSTEHYYRYRRLQYNLRVLLITEHQQYWSQLMAETASLHSKPREFWRKTKALMGTNNNDPHYLINNNNKKAQSDREKEQLHRQIWSEVFSGENEPEDDEADDHDTEVRSFLQRSSEKISPFPEVDLSRLDTGHPTTDRIEIDDIKDVIKRMKKSCPGFSGINKSILKQLPEAAIRHLQIILNSSLSAGYFPDFWKTATLRLIPKQGKNSHYAQNYRPISLLEVPGKIFERILNRRLRQHLEDNNLHNPHQHGFRQDRGTTSALALITEQIAQYKADNGQCNIVLRDISKAFDKVWHIGLKYKLLQLDLPEVLERLLCDFLDDRKARIRVGSVLGDTIDLNCGVPQGSVLAPTLFTIYTRDIPISQTGYNISYADDITQIIPYPGKSKEMLRLRTQREIERVNHFEKLWRIKTNTNKFKILRLGTRTGNDIVIDEEVIEFTNEGKVLGLTITTNGYAKHVDTRIIQAKRTLQKLYRFYTMPIHIKTHLVKTLVLPILDYPPIPTHTLSKTQIGKLQRTQNKALRFATNQRYPYTLNTEQIHINTKTEPLNIRLNTRAQKIWNKLELYENTHLTDLKNNQNNVHTYHRMFSSSETHNNQEAILH